MDNYKKIITKEEALSALRWRNIHLKKRFLQRNLVDYNFFVS